MKIIKFYSDTCGPCRVLDTNLQRAGIAYEAVNANSDENDALVEKYKIRAVPTLIKEDNDRNDQQKLIDTLVKAQVEGWKVKIKYHQVWGAKNVFNNRGESDYFVDDVIILDKNFSKIGDIVKGTNKTASHDTLYVKIVE